MTLPALLDAIEVPLLFSESKATEIFCNKSFLDTFVKRSGVMVSDAQTFRAFLRWLEENVCDGERFKKDSSHALAAEPAKYGFSFLLQNGEEFEVQFCKIGANQLWEFIDVSASRKKEELVQYKRIKTWEESRLASLGEMAAGIAHEINNPLSIIKAQSSFLKQMVKKSAVRAESVLESAELIFKLTDRISGIVKGLATLSRGAEQAELELVPLKSAVKDALDLCMARLNEKNIRISPEKIMDEKVWARAVQVSEVIYNLITNAAAAIENLPDPWIEIEPRETEDAILLSVMDSGPGIPGEIQAKIFEPFFTTKPVGKGLGLGLSISKSVMQSWGGDLELDPACANTRFVLRFPKHAEK